MKRVVPQISLTSDEICQLDTILNHGVKVPVVSIFLSSERGAKVARSPLNEDNFRALVKLVAQDSYFYKCQFRHAAEAGRRGLQPPRTLDTNFQPPKVLLSAVRTVHL